MDHQWNHPYGQETASKHMAQSPVAMTNYKNEQGEQQFSTAISLKKVPTSHLIQLTFEHQGLTDAETQYQ